MKLKIKVDDGCYVQERAHPTDAGLDLFTPESFWLYSGEHKSIDTGVHVEIPEGYVGLITSKSGLMLSGITSRGTIDSSYRGSIRAVLYNSGSEAVKFEKGRKITQLVIVPCLLPEIELVNELSETDRGDGGFGSTGE